MSTSEYNDLFIKCQNTGMYKLFTFDIVNSKLLEKNKRNIMQRKMVIVANILYDKLKNIELNTNNKILVCEKCDWNNNKSSIFYEPFILGDMFTITIFRDSINDDIIINEFNKLKEEYELDIDFHISTGYYETNDYGLGNELYYRGYCIDLVSKLHKEYNRKILKLINK